MNNTSRPLTFLKGLRGTVYIKRRIVTIDQKKYSRLLTSALPALIETEADNDRMLAIIEKLMDKGDAMSPEEEKLFKVLVHLNYIAAGVLPHTLIPAKW
jgi:hypothetical protein